MPENDHSPEPTKYDYTGKASFDHVYGLEDPRGYYGALGSLDYSEPEHGQRVFSAVVEVVGRRANGGGPNGVPKVVDLCCSYGVGAALLKCDLTLGDLYARYSSEEVRVLPGEELVAADARFYAGRRKPGAPEVVGIDVQEHPVAYAVEAGILDEGIVTNLEAEEPGEELERVVAGAGLITATGCVGYVVEKTFDRLLTACSQSGKKPWVAAFSTRMVHFEPIAEVLAGHGLVTEKLETHTFPRRRFTGPEEQAWVIEKLREKGLDPAGKETEGWYHVDFYLFRPAEEADMPLETLLAPALG